MTPTRQTLAHAIRILAIDAVQQAKSGHPGMPMGMADIAEVLWRDVLQHNPANPAWVNRDRFVLSNGHGSMLLYALLHLTGYDLSIEDLKQFRQLHSKTPGHPEVDVTPGVETSTGPLGQGIANAIGMAVAEQALASHFNRPGLSLVDHHTYAFLGDGCLMEGVSHEACSLAGTLGLGKLITVWDNNGISIDGQVEGWFTEDIPARFKAYGWHVVEAVDGHDAEAVKAAFAEAKAVQDKPSLICCRTTIGFGSPALAGTAACHGAPLGVEEIAAVRKQLQWDETEPFLVPEAVREAWDATAAGAEREASWQKIWEAYQLAYPEMAKHFERRMAGELPADWSTTAAAMIQDFQADSKDCATRKASQQCLEIIGAVCPELIGGSADLAGSNCTNWSGTRALSAQDFTGNAIQYGVREFAMFAMMNGMSLHGGFIPFGGTFMTFVDYARNAVRMAALMKRRMIAVLTHDSIGVGEDGPTHQPIEHLAMLRATPGVRTWRPCDRVETAVAWVSAVEQTDGPTCLALTRQGLPQQARTAEQVALIQRGAYVLQDCKGQPDVILMSSGSEVQLAMQAADLLAQKGTQVRVVSMPCMDLFLEQDASYQAEVLPVAVTARVAVEAAASDPWYRFVGLQGAVVGIDRFGESAPASQVYETLGITTAHVVAAAERLIHQQ